MCVLKININKFKIKFEKELLIRNKSSLFNKIITKLNLKIGENFL